MSKFKYPETEEQLFWFAVRESACKLAEFGYDDSALITWAVRYAMDREYEPLATLPDNDADDTIREINRRLGD